MIYNHRIFDIVELFVGQLFLFDNYVGHYVLKWKFNVFLMWLFPLFVNHKAQNYVYNGYFKILSINVFNNDSSY